VFSIYHCTSCLVFTIVPCAGYFPLYHMLGIACLVFPTVPKVWYILLYHICWYFLLHHVLVISLDHVLGVSHCTKCLVNAIVPHVWYFHCTPCSVSPIVQLAGHLQFFHEFLFFIRSLQYCLISYIYMYLIMLFKHLQNSFMCKWNSAVTHFE